MVVGLAVAVLVGVDVGVLVGVFVGLGVAVAVLVGVFVGLGMAVAVLVGVFEGLGVAVAVFVGLDVAVAVFVGLGVKVAVLVGSAVAVAVFVGLGDGDGDGVSVAVGVWVSGVVGVGVLLGRTGVSVGGGVAVEVLVISNSNVGDCRTIAPAFCGVAVASFKGEVVNVGNGVRVGGSAAIGASDLELNNTTPPIIIPPMKITTANAAIAQTHGIWRIFVLDCTGGAADGAWGKADAAVDVAATATVLPDSAGSQ